MPRPNVSVEIGVDLLRRLEVIGAQVGKSGRVLSASVVIRYLVDDYERALRAGPPVGGATLFQGDKSTEEYRPELRE